MATVRLKRPPRRYAAALSHPLCLTTINELPPACHRRIFRALKSGRGCGVSATPIPARQPLVRCLATPRVHVVPEAAPVRFPMHRAAELIGDPRVRRVLERAPRPVRVFAKGARTAEVECPRTAVRPRVTMICVHGGDRQELAASLSE